MKRDEQRLRERALEHAIRARRTNDTTADDVIVAARKYYEFLSGKKEN